MPIACWMVPLKVGRTTVWSCRQSPVTLGRATRRGTETTPPSRSVLPSPLVPQGAVQSSTWTPATPCSSSKTKLPWTPSLSVTYGVLQARISLRSEWCHWSFPSTHLSWPDTENVPCPGPPPFVLLTPTSLVFPASYLSLPMIHDSPSTQPIPFHPILFHLILLLL